MMRSKPRRWTPAEDEFVRESYGKMPVKEIAKVLGRKPPMVYSRAIKCLGLYITGPRPRGESILHNLRDIYQEVIS